MKKVMLIAWRDFKAYFISPIGYLVISSFLFVIGFMFYQRLAFFVQQSMVMMKFGKPVQVGLNTVIVNPLFGTINLLFLFIVPLITMRLLAEEKKQNYRP